MSGETLARFQGYPLRELVFRRSRGYGADGAEMLLFASDFPAGFDFTTPAPGALVTPVGAPSFQAASALPGRPSGPAALAKRLEYEGWLEMSETAGGTTWAHPPVRLFVVGVETVRRADTGVVELVKVTAVDARFHAEQGRLRRWSYNRRRADGSVSLDSVNTDGSLVTRRQIVDEIASRMFRAPKVSHAPAEWSTITLQHDFNPGAAPLVALAQLVTAADLVDPCLRLDETIALHASGDGMVGYAEGGKGPNTRAFPPQLLLSKNGTGQGSLVEFTYPADYVVVVGGVRVATVAIDDLEPVLVLDDGTVIVVNERNVRALTGGKRGLEWLKRWVIAAHISPGAGRGFGDPEVPEWVCDLFRSQAYVLWRVPSVEREQAAGLANQSAPPALPAGPESQGDAARDLTRERAARGPQADRPDPANAPGLPVVRGPGPNAHLMPMLARAETRAGKRLPITVEAYFKDIRHRALRKGGDGQARAETLRKLRDVREQIDNLAAARKNPSPFSSQGEKVGFIDGLRGVQRVDPHAVLSREAQRALEGAEIGEAVRRARQVEQIKDLASAELAQQYEAALAESFKFDESGKSAALHALARKFLDYERQANEKGGRFDTTLEAFRGRALDALFSADALDAARAIKLGAEEQARREALGVAGADGSREGPDMGAQTYAVNIGRVIDASGGAWDDERGIVSTGAPAGHWRTLAIHDGGHPDAIHEPKPVRVLFGATVRPRIDVPPGARPPRPVTGDVPEGNIDAPGGQTYIPECLSDEESIYMAAFKRGPNGEALPVRVEDVPAGQELVVYRPDLVELVPLEGESNKGALDLEAAGVAADLFKRKALVKTSHTVVARPWPVQCDGVVDEVTIVMRQKDGAPCGFETHVRTGSVASSGSVGVTREDPARRGAAALRAQNDAAQREGLKR